MYLCECNNYVCGCMSVCVSMGGLSGHLNRQFCSSCSRILVNIFLTDICFLPACVCVLWVISEKIFAVIQVFFHVQVCVCGVMLISVC